MKKTKAPLGSTLIVLSSAFYASYGIWTKLMGDFFGGYTASALRSVVVLILLFPVAVLYRKLEPLDVKHNWRYLAGMLVASLFIWGPFYYAILHAGVGISLTINYASIVIGMFFFGWVLLKERFTRDKGLSAALGLIGLALVFSPGLTGRLSLLALSGALISGFAVAANMVLAKQMPYKPTQTTLVLWSTSVISNAIMTAIFRESMPAIGWHIEWLYLVFFAVASVVASWAFIAGMKRVEAGAAGILGLLEIVFGVLFGVLLFNERPGVIVLSGIIVIIVAAAIPYIKDYNAKKSNPEARSL